MWKPASRARLGLSLFLGVMAGLALISIPALVSSPQAANADKGVSPTTAFTLSISSPSPSTNATQNSTANNLTLAFNLFLILLPASVLSIIVRRWASRKLEEYWYY